MIGIGKSFALQLALRGRELVRLQPRDPGGEHEIGLEGVDRRAQRLQHIGLHGRRRAKQAGGDAGKQLALGEAVLHQARMHVDGARQRNAVDRELLLVHAPSRAPESNAPISPIRPTMKPRRTTRLPGNERCGNESSDRVRMMPGRQQRQEKCRPANRAGYWRSGHRDATAVGRNADSHSGHHTLVTARPEVFNGGGGTWFLAHFRIVLNASGCAAGPLTIVNG